MPLYEFRCDRCGTSFEQLVGLSEGTPSCPGCGGPDVHRTLSRFVAGPSRRPVADFSRVPFDRCGCGGGACRHH